MTNTEIMIELDRKHRALRSGNRWAITRLQTDGSYDLVSAWNGGRRSLYRWCENNDVHPDRDAEAALELIPELDGFRDRG
jgi:hypothetical protein